ncbi:MAG TPA: hypothetical protein VHC69_25775 [Polyangiaceae bacterium]|nr:hypothetical protein [Polyangiaceae bacterium]
MKIFQSFLMGLLGVYLYAMTPSPAKNSPLPPPTNTAVRGVHSDAQGHADATIALLPEHLTSNTGNRRIGVEVTRAGEVPSMIMTELQSRVALLTYPDGIDVPATVTVRNDTGHQTVNGKILPARETYAHIDIVPTSPLDDRWYELVVWKLPNSISVWGDGMLGTVMPDGSVRSRFSPTSHPIVRSVSHCLKHGGGGTEAAVQFSEDISDNARSGFAVTNLSGRGKCTISGGPGQFPRGASASCENADLTDTIDFLIGGVRSRSGVGLREFANGVETAAQRHYSLNFAKMPGDSTCRQWRPD